MPRRADAAAYAALLGRLDDWFAAARATRPAVPCAGGCTACCHGPFDVSVADVELLVEAVRALAAAERAEVLRRARAQVARFAAHEPGWEAPWDVASLGEGRFDALCESDAHAPCPLLDDGGRCRVYASRPLVCRLLGLGMATPAGRVLANACPIQDRFPGYAALAPVPFELEAFEAAEEEALRDAARRLVGDEAAAGYETTIATALVFFAGADGD